jgi:hypothetical protein
MRLKSRLPAWIAAMARVDGPVARRFARTSVIAFLAGAVGIACPPAKPNEGSPVAHPGPSNRAAH